MRNPKLPRSAPVVAFQYFSTLRAFWQVSSGILVASEQLALVLNRLSRCHLSLPDHLTAVDIDALDDVPVWHFERAHPHIRGVA